MEAAQMANTLKVPGANLYYEMRGSGPTLLLISGGPTDANVYAGIAPLLAGSYSVVTYDPRGNSRSTLDNPITDLTIDIHGDDAARLLDAVGQGPAYVFGNSGGALIGLNLAARYPEKGTHAGRARATGRRALAGRRRAPRPLTGDLRHVPKPGRWPGDAEVSRPRRTERRSTARCARRPFQSRDDGDHGTNGEEHRAVPRAWHAGDQRLRARHRRANGVTTRVDCRRRSIRGSTGLPGGSRPGGSARLGVVHFPGDHGGFTTHPEAFATRLRQLLASNER